MESIYKSENHFGPALQQHFVQGVPETGELKIQNQIEQQLKIFTDSKIQSIRPKRSPKRIPKRSPRLYPKPWLKRSKLNKQILVTL